MAKGRHTHRFEDNPEEQRFAEAWAKHNGDGQTLAWLLDERPMQTGRPFTRDVREEVVAATVIQWLGSPVGQSFLEGLGYRQVSTGSSTRKAPLPTSVVKAVRRYLDRGAKSGSRRATEQALLIHVLDCAALDIQEARSRDAK